MQVFKRSTAWLMVLCLLLGFALSVGPVAPAVNAAGYDPYVFVLGPSQSEIPAYYRPYAMPFVGWSAHEVGYYDIVRMFNMTNVGEVLEQQPADFDAKDPYASIAALCCDHGTPYRFGARYRTINFEDAYFSQNGNQNSAKRVRAIVRHSLPYRANAAVVQQAVNEYFGSEKVENLTNGELAAATQAALWHFTNGDDFGTEPYFCTVDFKASGNASAYGSDIAKCISTSEPLNLYEKQTSYTEDNINSVYQYLIALPGEEATDILIEENSLSVKKAVFAGAGHNGALTLFVEIDGTVDGDDELVLSARCGDQTKNVAVGNGGIAKTADGLFPITLTGISQADCSDLELELTGKQTINDAMFFEAEPKGSWDAREASQGFGGYTAVGTPIQAMTTANPLQNAEVLEIVKADAASGNPLSGVSFDLYMKQNGNDLKIGSYTTDVNGKITATVTDADEYYFVETKALAGYEPVTGNVTAGRVPNSWKAGSLQLTKKLINETPAKPDETFDFKLTLDLSTAPVMGNGISWMTAEYLKGQLESSKALTWSVSGNKLTAVFTLNADETVTVDSIPLGTGYTLEEVMTAEDQEWFTVSTQVDNGTARKGNTVAGTIAAKNAVVFTNSVVTGEVELGELAVSKKLVNTTPAQVGETFNFKITLDLSTADAKTNGTPWMTEEYLLGKISCTEKLNWSEKGGKYTATFTVDADETVTIKGIAQGTTYTVEEVLTAEDREWFTVTSKVDNQSAKDSNTANGTVAAKNAVLFTNTVVTTDVQLGNLNVSKKLINTTPAQVGETFNFKITLDLRNADALKNGAPWMDEAYLMNKISCSEKLSWININGKYTANFTVDADETVVIQGIAYGATYTVEEVLTAEEREWFTVTSKVGNEATQNSNTAAGTIAQLNAILFTNTVVTTDVQLGNLNVSKKLVNTTPAQVGETFNFQITIDLSTADVYKDPVFWMNDEYLLDFINSTESLTWTGKNGKYTATFTVDADETVIIKGLAYGTTYTVEELLTDEDRAWFTITTKVNNEAVQNSDAAQGTVAALNGVLFTNTVVTGDELRLGDLNVSKKLVNTTPAQVGETFNFKITLDLRNADALQNGAPWMDEAYLMNKISCSEKLSWININGKYTANFTVDADETVTIKGIAYGVTYQVEEILTAQDREQFTVTSQVNSEAAQNSNTAAGTVAQRNAVVFTNTVATADVQLGDLNVSKKLINTTPAVVGETFNFQITLDLSTADAYTEPVFWMNDEYLLSLISSTENLTWAEKDGKYTATFTVDADETVTISGIAQGTTYTVEEILTAEERTWFTVTSQIGNAAAQNSSSVQNSIAAQNALLFTNTVVTNDVQLSSLNVSKKLVNTTPAQVGETFNFRITLDLRSANAYENAAPWLNDEYLLGKISSTENLTWTEANGKYTATFTVDADETVIISGIAQGTTYTVEETLTNEERAQFTVTSQIGNAAAQNSTIAEGTVGSLNAVLFTNSVVDQDVELGDLNVSKKLVNTTPAVVGETFNFKITLDLSTADAYTDPVFWMNDDYLLDFISSTESLTWTEVSGKYTATFTVDADETVTITGIAQGATYTVEEILTAEDRTWFTVTSKVDGNPANNSSTANGTVAEKNAILFTNTVVTNDVQVGNLQVSKKLVNNTPAQVGETFNFKITLDLRNADAYENAAPWLNDEYLLGKISSTENLTWTEVNGKYTATFTVDADETVIISGIACGATYTVEEVLTTEALEQFIITVKVGNEDPKNSTTAEGSIAAVNAVLFTNTVKSTEVSTGVLEVSKKLINTTPAVVGETFNFKITVDFATADAYQNPVFWMNDGYLLNLINSSETMVWAEKDGKYTANFTVDADETVTIDGIAQGTTYTVEEVLTAEDREWFTVTSKVDGNPVNNSSIANGTVAEKNAVLFTNTVVTGPELKLGDPCVSKKLVNTTPAEVRETFDFQITVDFSTADVYTDAAPWMNDEYLMGFVSGTEELTWTEKDGKYTATFSVKANETFTVAGLAYGTTYTVQELFTAEDYEWFTVTCQVGQEEATASQLVVSTVGDNNDIVFTNSVVTTDVQLGTMEISKKLVNTTPAVVGETFNFRITLDLRNADAYQNAVPWMNDDYLMSFISSTEDLTWTEKDGKYTATFTVDADETVTIEGIAQGATYTVEEVLTAEEREQFTVTSKVDSAAAKNSTAATSTVAAKNAVIFTNSVVTADVKLGSLDVSKKLVNETPAQVGETFNFKITIDLRNADAYTDPVFWMNDDYLMGFISSTEDLNWTAEDGKYTATFTVDADETVTFEGLALGATYTVEEILTEEELKWFIGSAQIGDGETLEGRVAQSTVAEKNAVIFTNSVVTGPVLVTGAIEVSKKLVNTTPAKVGEIFRFRITLDLSTADVYTDAAPWMNDEYLMSFIAGTEDLIWTAENGKYTADFTVNVDETFTVSGIAQGSSYTVQEILTEEDREWFTVTSKIGDGEEVDSALVESTVAEKNAILFTNSVVTGIGLNPGTMAVTKKLTDAAEAKNNVKFTFRLTLDLSQADIYQDPAPWMYDEYLLDQIDATQDLTWTKVGEKKYAATFVLKADETIFIDGIAEGTGYTLEEILSETDRNLYRVSNAATTDGKVVEGQSSLVIGSVGDDNEIIITNKYLEPVPVTDDLSLTAPVVLCLMSVLMGAVLMLNKRRIIG